MRNIKLTIEYDGKRYHGWQRLKDSDKTIQGKIEYVLSEMTEEKIEIIGSGRTDAGAHAKGQVANFKTESNMSRQKMMDYLNYYLPNDVVVNKVEEVPERFHSRYNCSGKQYSYYIWNTEVPSVFKGQHSFHYADELDMDKINEACQKLVGEHDFLGFSSLKRSKKSSVRTIKELSMEQEGNMLRFIFVGDGFLYNMVRIIMGTLLEIGSGEQPVELIDEIFEDRIRENAGDTVPSYGLFLDEVYYN